MTWITGIKERNFQDTVTFYIKPRYYTHHICRHQGKKKILLRYYFFRTYTSWQKLDTGRPRTETWDAALELNENCQILREKIVFFSRNFCEWMFMVEVGYPLIVFFPFQFSHYNSQENVRNSLMSRQSRFTDLKLLGHFFPIQDWFRY